MSGKDILSLDEFALAGRKARKGVIASLADVKGTVETGVVVKPAVRDSQEMAEMSSNSGNTLRRLKRARMKGGSYFVNVKLDRDTKRRLKLASLNMETSMQAIMERAIRQYLDANGN